MSEAKGITVLAICGSLRAGLVQQGGAAHRDRAEAGGMTIETADIGSIPLYNEDVRALGFPPPVEKLRAADRGGRRAALRHPRIQLLDARRAEERDRLGLAPARSALRRQAVAIMGAAAGMAGTARAQYDLRRSCVFLDMHPLNKPEVLIGQAQTKFDASGRLTDDAARGFIRDMLVALEKWTRQIGRKMTELTGGNAMDLDFTGKVALITGGANGIGRATALGFRQGRRQGGARRPRRGGRRGDRRGHPAAGRRGALRRRRRHQIGRGAGLCQGGARRLWRDRLLLQQCRHRRQMGAHRRI